MSRPDRFLKFVKLVFPRSFRPSVITKIPFIARKVEKAFFEGDDMILVPKDSVLPVNRKADDIGQFAVPSKIIEHFLDRAGFIWIMDFCICRRSNDCKNHPHELGCIFMGEAARDINPHWGREATPAEAKVILRQCREAGLVHCIGKSKLDTKWLGIGPGDKLMTICNCCTCCCITRGIPYVAKNLADKFARMPGIRMRVNDNCSGCGTCGETCYINAIGLFNDKAFITDECRACGRCAEVCPQGAIELIVEDDKYIQNTIKRIEKLADISG